MNKNRITKKSTIGTTYQSRSAKYQYQFAEVGASDNFFNLIPEEEITATEALLDMRDALYDRLMDLVEQELPLSEQQVLISQIEGMTQWEASALTGITQSVIHKKLYSNKGSIINKLQTLALKDPKIQKLLREIKKEKENV